MVAISKLFVEPLNCIACGTIVHPNISCSKFLLNFSFELLLQSLKYYMPFFVAPLLLHCNRLGWKLIYDSFKYYSGAVVCASSSMAISFGLLCVFRRALGKFNLSHGVILPIICGMSLSWFYPERVFRTFSTYMLQMALEAALGQYSHRNPLCRLTMESKTLRTLIFMLSGAIILHFKKAGTYRGFWFITPNTITLPSAVAPTLTATTRQQCANAQIEEHWVNRFIANLKSLFYRGLALDLLRALLHSNVSQHQNKGRISLTQLLCSKVKGMRFNMISFFLVYDSIYTLTQVLLDKYKVGSNSNIKHFVAAFMGGVGYACVDKTMLMLFSLLIAVQLLWTNFAQRIHKTNAKTNAQKLINKIVNLPMARLIFPFHIAYCVQCYFLHPEAMSRLSTIFMEKLTNDKFKEIRTFITVNDLHQLIELNMNNKCKGYFR